MKEANTPKWFDKSINNGTNFKSVYGFDQTYKNYTPNINNQQSVNTNLETGYMDISGYSYFINNQSYGATNSVSIIGKKGNYVVKYDSVSNSNNIPTIIVEKTVCNSSIKA